ncbi:hypothetical protein [Bradyrhizobium yuanmingense]|uniref:hypothetical protein n=1 Tax=Bradyrhizobium yuanmingense TaxID=108015 RepID=UPI0023BA0F3E|nr:hypothetical protein [Bradyrhizobium yuanmingense]MDF0494851.1 hypothetical protein [Bradyrhizobium yuanmingense]
MKISSAACLGSDLTFEISAVGAGSLSNSKRNVSKKIWCDIRSVCQSARVAQLEAAREATAEAYRELDWAGHALVATTPADPKALVDLLLYMEKNFGTLPQEWADRWRST